MCETVSRIGDFVFEFYFGGREMAMAMGMGDLLSWPRVQVPGCGSRGIVPLQGLRRRRVVVLEESKRPLAMHKEFLDQVNELCVGICWIGFPTTIGFPHL